MTSEFEFIENIRTRLFAVKNRRRLRRFAKRFAKRIWSSRRICSSKILILDSNGQSPNLSDTKRWQFLFRMLPRWARNLFGRCFRSEFPKKIWKTDFVEKFYDGYMNLAKKFNVELIGGDVSKTPDKIVIDSIVAGEVKKGKAVLRSNCESRRFNFCYRKFGRARQWV